MHRDNFQIIMTDRRKPHLYNSRNKPSPTNPTSVPLPGAWPAEGETKATLYRFPSPHLLAMDTFQNHLDLVSENTVHSSSTYADIPEQASANAERHSECVTSTFAATQKLPSRVNPEVRYTPKGMRHQENMPLFCSHQPTTGTRAERPQPPPVDPSTLQIGNAHERELPHRQQEYNNSFTNMALNSITSERGFDKISAKAPTSMTKLPPSVSALKASAAASHVDTSVATSHFIDRDTAASDTQRRPVSSQPHIAAQTSKLDLTFDKEMQNITNHLGNINIAARSNVHLGLDCTPTSRVASQPQLYDKGTLGGELQVDSTSSQKSLPISDSMSNMDKQPPPRTYSLYSTLDPKDYPLKTYGPSPYKPMCGESNSEGPVNMSTEQYSQRSTPRNMSTI